MRKEWNRNSGSVNPPVRPLYQLRGSRCYTHYMTANPPPVPGFNIDAIPDAPTPSKTARTPKPRDETVVLRGVAVPLNSDIGGALVADLSRNKERLFSDAQVIEKYDIQPTDWTQIKQSKAIRLAVNKEHERRTFNGDAAREAAATQFVKAPAILGTILENERASPRHRISAAQELRQTAHAGIEKAKDSVERVHIVINLGADERLEFNKQVAPIQPNEAWKNPDAE